MRLLMTTDTIGGVWSYSITLARALADRGINTILSTMGPAPSAAQRAAANAVPGLDLKVSEFALEWMSEPWDEVDRAGHWLERVASDHDVDLVHLNGYAHGNCAFGVPRLVVAHSCVCSWWQAVKRAPVPAAWDTYRRRVTDGLRSADAVVAPTRWMQAQTHALYGRPRVSRVIFNGCDRRRARPRMRDQIVLTAGRAWDEAKNLAVLDAASASIAWPVMVAGDQALPGATPEATMTRLTMLGRLTPDAMETRYASAGIYAHPARYEPFGLAPLEAAHAGCALVLSDIPPLRELWTGAAAFVSPDDPAEWARQINHLIDNPAERRTRASRARMLALRYSVDSMADAYAALYQQLTGAQSKVHT